jgi:hypothetical protein
MKQTGKQNSSANKQKTSKAANGMFELENAVTKLLNLEGWAQLQKAGKRENLKITQ